VTFLVFVLGGATIGNLVGVELFGDPQLRRLVHSHQLDRAHNIERQKFSPTN